MDGIIIYTTDFEKAEMLARTAREHGGNLYCMIGLHMDMIKRNSDKLTQQRLEQLRDLAVRSETVAVMTGLDLTRDIATRCAACASVCDWQAIDTPYTFGTSTFDRKAFFCERTM